MTIIEKYSHRTM